MWGWNSQISRRSSRCSRRQDEEAPEALILSEAPEAHRGNDRFTAAMILLGNSGFWSSTTTKKFTKRWCSYGDLPLRRWSPLAVDPPTATLSVSTKTSLCNQLSGHQQNVDGDLPLVSSLPPRVHVFCPDSYQWSLLLLISWGVPQTWEG